MRFSVDFFKGKSVFVTGHTGFKGMWLCKWLSLLGANVTGYALPFATEESAEVFRRSGVETTIRSFLGDVRDFYKLKSVFDGAEPEIVFHLAAQPIVLEGYRDPVNTYSTNVMGTVNLLECVRKSNTVKSFLNITTDKVYENHEWTWGYRENDALDGYDPYSNSKSCSELVTKCFRRSFFSDKKVAISTARAGNVIGGGDVSVNRIIPDCVRAACQGRVIKVRNPSSVRPYQHVLEPLNAYLMIAEAQYKNGKFAGTYNIGPDEDDCVETGKLAKMFCAAWGEGLTWKDVDVEQPHEASCLRLDCSKMKSTFGWKPRWNVQMAVGKTVEWAKAYRDGEDMGVLTERQIAGYGEEQQCNAAI